MLVVVLVVPAFRGPGHITDLDLLPAVHAGLNGVVSFVGFWGHLVGAQVACVLYVVPHLPVVTDLAGDDVLFPHPLWHFYHCRHCADCFHSLCHKLFFSGAALPFNSGSNFDLQIS